MNRLCDHLIHNVIALPFKERRVDRPQKKAYSQMRSILRSPIFKRGPTGLKTGVSHAQLCRIGCFFEKHFDLHPR